MKDVEKSLYRNDQIWEQMEKIIVNQNLSVLNSYGSKLGCYGIPGNFGCQSGHVAYRRNVAKQLTWTSPKDYVFTKYEDFDFNLMLLLTSNNAMQVDLPLIYYRLGTSSNLVDY